MNFNGARREGCDPFEVNPSCWAVRARRSLVDRVARVQRAGQPGHVGEDVADIHGTLRLDEPDCAVWLHVAHLERAPLGNEAVDRVGELEHACSYSCISATTPMAWSSIDTKDGVVGHGQLPFPVHQPERP